MPTKLQQYRGMLNAQQIVDGMNAAIRNACRLADDAKTMLDLKRYPTAAALAILSIEESGKINILRGIARAPDKKACQELWNNYSNHRRKNAPWIVPDLWKKGARDLDSLLPVFDPNASHTAFLEQVKQSGLYTDYRGNSDWSEPEKEIDTKAARRLVDTAILLTPKTIITLKEIELWIKHMKPVCDAPLECQKKALLDWFTEMIKNGLLKEGDIAPEDYIWGSRSNNM